MASKYLLESKLQPASNNVSPISKPANVVENTRYPSLKRGRFSSRRIIPLTLTEEYVRRIFSTKAKERNNNNTIQQFLKRWQHHCSILGSPLSKSVIDIVNDQKGNKLKFGRLDLNHAEAANLGDIEIAALAEALIDIPVIRDLNISRHLHLATNKTVDIFVKLMECQLSKWTTMIPLSVQRRRVRTDILLEQRRKEREESCGNQPENAEIDQLNDNRKETLTADVYLTGVANLNHSTGMPVFLLQEIKYPDFFHTKVVSLFRSQEKSKKANNGITRQQNERLSETSKMMVVCNRELEARRLFYDFDINKNGVLTANEVHLALKSLGLSVTPEESDRLVKFISTVDSNAISEDDFVHVVAYRVRSAMVKNQVFEQIKNLQPKDAWLLHPLESKWVKMWDLLIVCLLIILSFLTPFEVAFFEVSLSGWWFIFNRTIDVFFWLDVLMHFFLMYPKGADSEGQWIITWERNHLKIAKNYLRKWFVVDFLSSFPFDVVAFAATAMGPLRSNMRLLRITRLFRLMKLAKLVSGARQWNAFENFLSLRHTVAETMRVVITMFFCAHWTACVWMLVVSLERDFDLEDHSNTWVRVMEVDTWEYRQNPDEPWPLDPYKMYTICFYWSMQTLTTIGYGDSAGPTNSNEFIVASFAMMVGSIVWAYLIGKIGTLMHFLSRNSLEHHQMMDSLEDFITDKKLSKSLADRLRVYFLKRRSLDKDETYRVIINHMSPTLRGDVAETLTGPWLHRVSWLRNAEPAFVTSLAMLMHREVYPPMEMISGETFHVVVRGVVIKDMQVMCSGQIWGFDMILHNKSLRRMRPAIALTYVEVLKLGRLDFFNLLSRFPEANKRVRKAVIWLAFRRKFLAHAREIELLTSQIGKLLLQEVGSRERVRVNFLRYDQDGDGFINAQEFSSCMRDLGFEARSDIIENLLIRFDSDNDGKISLSEFFSFFDSYSKESSRLLHIGPKKRDMFAITSNLGHHVVDAEHGLIDEKSADDVVGEEAGKLVSFPSKSNLLNNSKVVKKTETMLHGMTKPSEDGNVHVLSDELDELSNHHFSNRDIRNLHANQALNASKIQKIHEKLDSHYHVLCQISKRMEKG